MENEDKKSLREEISDDERIHLELFAAIDTFKKYYINEFSYKEYKINDYEEVFLIEDSLIIYFYASGESSYFVKELTLNNLYNYTDKYFWRKCINPVWDYPMNINYIKFTGNVCELEYYPYLVKKELYITREDSTEHPRFNLLEYIDNKLPELELKARHESWGGWDVYFIIYELLYKNQKGYAIDYTLDKNPIKYAIKREQAIEDIATHPYMFDDTFMFVTKSGKENEQKIKERMEYCSGIGKTLFDKDFYKIANELEEEYWRNKNNFDETVNGRRVLFSGYMNYWVEIKKIRDIKTIFDIEQKILRSTAIKANTDIEKMEFKQSEYKWKSEDLMIKCLKKVFPNNKIIRQHKPYFLYVNNGQMSYDAYISGMNIAFEYQGKQHFEPVDYFGGIEAYEKQHERDLLKSELSRKNGVKLIYINYDEDISTELIRKKLSQIGIEV